MEKDTHIPSPVTGRVEWKGSTLLGPVPAVLVTCGPADKPNVLTVSWTGLCCTRPPMTYISVRRERYSHRLLCEGGCFVINLPTRRDVRGVDFCGTYTGAKVDKTARLGWDTVPSPTVGTAMLKCCPVSLSCRVTQVIPLGSHDMFLATVEGISVDPALLCADGRLDMERGDFLCAMHGAYYALGECLGRLGCSTKPPVPESHREASPRRKPSGGTSRANGGPKPEKTAPASPVRHAGASPSTTRKSKGKRKS